MLDALGIAQKEMNEALQRARYESRECQNLLRLVRACRKKRTAKKASNAPRGLTQWVGLIFA